jgi:CBS domain-containing protein
MQIGTILATKGSDVLVVTSGATVLEASRLLASGGVGALVVSSDGSAIDGIVSERDIARVVADRGAEGLEVTVEQVMTRDVTTCSLDDTIDHLMAVMTERRVRHLPVVVDGSLAGIVSIGDVVKHRLSELETEAQTLHDYITIGR